MTWIDGAACATSSLPAAAWTEKGSGHWGTSPAHRQAIRVCHGCPVNADCLLWQLDWEGSGLGAHERNGIYAGTTPGQRVLLAARMKPARRAPSVRRGEVRS